MDDYSAKIVIRFDINCAGLKVRTSMADSAKDCPALWGKFEPRMGELSPHPAESYGVSMTIDENTFDYWAVMPLADGAQVPAGMEEFRLPGGQFVRFDVPSLGALGGCYEFAYGQWPAANKEHLLDFARPCYELYNEEYMEKGNFWLYCPVTK